MTLSVRHVKDLQFFLIDAAKRYAGPRNDAGSLADDLLSSAASLDYVLLIASERPGDMLDAAGPIATGVCETVTRATLTSLRFMRGMLAEPSAVFSDFAQRHIEQSRILATLQALALAGAVQTGDARFAIVTTASDVLERCRR